MQPARNERPKKKELWFQCRRYFLRTIKREDASDHWASWLSDPWTIQVLNSVMKPYSKSDIVEYIKQFDQRSRLLLGIFETGSRLHVGFIRVDIDYAARQALVNAVIGEPAHRNRGATTEVFVPLLDYLFDSVEVAKVKASVLRRNRVTLEYLLKLGWQVDETSETQVKSTSDGTPLGVCTVIYTRDAYHVFRQSGLGKRILQGLAAAERARLHGSSAKRGS
jgi:RimJ/RimL family protein N-acetyltransferase